jgi:hypothetical protein
LVFGKDPKTQPITMEGSVEDLDKICKHYDEYYWTKTVVNITHPILVVYTTGDHYNC